MGRSSSKQGIKLALGGEMETDNSGKEEPHLSGAYIRSLVKQLTSSRPKDPRSVPDQEENGGVDAQNSTKMVEPQPQPHKKQVRRRLHTSRPYQERLLNMAEARREIVTALKFHRASMKQQQNEQQLQQPQQELQSSFQSNFQESEPEMVNYSSNTSNYSSYHNMDSVSYSSVPLYSSTPPNPYSSWSMLAPPPLSIAENFNLSTLPHQALGLNLNIHDFNNSNYYYYPSFSSSSSSSPSFSTPTTTEEITPNFVASSEEAGMNGGGLHAMMDDEEMAEIRSIGEQHEMEWNDRMNLVTSAWWFKYLNSMEIGHEEMSVDEDGYGSPFDQVMEFPSWLVNANEACLEQHFNDLSPSDYFQDPALACMDIEEIEGIDGEWLA